MSDAEQSNPPPAVAETVSPVEAPRKRRWLAVLLSLAIFVSGGMVGSGATVIAIKHIILYRLEHPDAPPVLVARTLNRKLGLSKEQKTNVTRTLMRHQAALGGLWGEFYPRLRAEFEALQADVAKDLNDEQAGKWKAMSERAWEKWVPPQPATRQNTILFK